MSSSLLEIPLKDLYCDWKRFAVKSDIEIKVRGYHLDIYSHVNNARYLEFLEEGRWAALEAIDDVRTLLAKGYALVLVNINISYLSSATAGDTLLIQTGILKTGTKSVTMSQKIFKKEDMAPVVDAVVTFVLVDIKTGRSVELNDRIRRYFV